MNENKRVDNSIQSLFSLLSTFQNSYPLWDSGKRRQLLLQRFEFESLGIDLQFFPSKWEEAVVCKILKDISCAIGSNRLIKCATVVASSKSYIEN